MQCLMFSFWNYHSHEKRSLESSLDRVLFATESEFPKILVPRLLLNSSNCKHWMCQKTKRTVFFIWSISWSTDISSFCYSDINLILIEYVSLKLCNIWFFLFENNSRSYNYTGTSHWKKNMVAVVTEDRVIDENLRQSKNRTFYTCRLFLLTRTFQYISNWSKVIEHLLTIFL